MDVLLVDPALRRGVPEPYENLGVASLAAAARRGGFHTHTLLNHVEGWSRRRLGRELLERQPAVLGLSLLSFHARPTLDLVRDLKQAGLRSRVVAGGHFPTFNDGRLLAERPEIDAVVRGEGDLSLVALLQAWREGRDPVGVAGVSWRSPEGTIQVNPMRSLVEDLDTMPWPVRDHTDRIIRAGGTLNLVRSRGCFANCAFCSIGSFYRMQKGPAWRQRSVADVVAEMESLTRRWPGVPVKFYDDQFIGPGRRGREDARAFAEALITRGSNVPFSIFARADTVEPELFRVLKAAGLRSVFVGIESGSQRELDEFNKHTTVEDNLAALKVLQGLDIRFQMGLIFFDPYTQMDDVQANMDFIRRTRPLWSTPGNVLSVENRAIVYKGTPFYERLKAEDRLKGDWMEVDYSLPDRGVRILMKISHLYLNTLLPAVSLVRRLPDRLRRLGRNLHSLLTRQTRASERWPVSTRPKVRGTSPTPEVHKN